MGVCIMRSLIAFLFLSSVAFAQQPPIVEDVIPRVPDAPRLAGAKALAPTQKPLAAQQQKPQLAQAQKTPLQTSQAQQQKGKGFSSSRSVEVRGSGIGGRLTLRDRLKLLRRIRQLQREDRQMARASSPPQTLRATLR